MEKGKKYILIGTVVMLKGGTKRLMILGFYAVSEKNKDVVYDYSGCLYPEGLLSSEQVALFNHEQIETIHYMGLVDEEEKEFKKRLKELENDIDNTKKQ